MIIPYRANDGIPTFTDSFIKGLYRRAADEGLADLVFYDGFCRSEEDFLNMMKFGHNSLFVVALEDGIAGVVWLNNFEARSAQFHFCFFNSLRGKNALREGKDIVCELLYMENNGPVFDLLTGVVPVANVSANRWCRMIGFGVLGVLPNGVFNFRTGQSEPVKVYYAERGVYGKR